MYQEKCFKHWGGHQQSWQCWRADAYEQCAVSNTSTKGCNINKKTAASSKGTKQIWYKCSWNLNNFYIWSCHPSSNLIFSLDCLFFSIFLNTTAIYGASKITRRSSKNEWHKFRTSQTTKILHNYHHQGHCCARSRVFCTWEPGVSAASRARKMLIRWSMSSRFLGAWAVPKRGSPSGHWLTGKNGFSLGGVSISLWWLKRIATKNAKTMVFCFVSEVVFVRFKFN